VKPARIRCCSFADALPIFSNQPILPGLPIAGRFAIRGTDPVLAIFVFLPPAGYVVIAKKNRN
jgi:hypothetical protein